MTLLQERDEHSTLEQVAAAFRSGDVQGARQLTRNALQANPRSVPAWEWAYRLSESREQQLRCLDRILTFAPDHTQARSDLLRLQQEVLGTVPPVPQVSPASKGRPLGLDILLFPFEWATRSPFWAVLILVGLVALAGVLYFRANTDFLGLAGPDFDTLTVSDTGEEVQSGDLYWQITYESPLKSKFTGLVRHVSSIRAPDLRILTHDILVTSGEYADPDLVKTSVRNHHFYWTCHTKEHPQGRINLLHTVPVNAEVYEQLLSIRNGDEVIITGREILQIKVFRDGAYRGEWHDTGCNTLLVDSVTIVPH